MSALIKKNESQEDGGKSKEDIVCPECGTIHPWYRTHCNNCKINLRDVIKRNISEIKNNQLFVICVKCNHSYSKRADKCPKCETPVNDVCFICKKLIPKTSEICPVCGDPDPFDSSGEIIIKPPPIIKRNDDIIPKLQQLSEEKIKPYNEKNNSKSFWKWPIIIFSVLFLAPLFSNIAYFLIYNTFFGELPTANRNQTLPSGFPIMVIINLVVGLWTYKFIQSLFTTKKSEDLNSMNN